MRFLLAAPLLLILAACTTAQTPAPNTAVPPPPGLGVADATGGASGCAAALANFQKVVDADNSTGNVNASVYARINKDLAPARAECQAGRDAQARSALASVRARYGYP
ncbi:hypothetical protein ABLE91_15140 [Aquabacter sp. CN5-332]|uniref:hypothetical protein n=1 Tax=Aquabacter sp. CN5-332 TaxID=3156608 RepID=UPI0032B39F90